MYTCPPLYTEPTLMLDSLTSILEDVRNMDGVSRWLQIAEFKILEIKQQCGSVSQCKRTYSVYWLTHHPAPSWKVVAIALWSSGEHGALEVLQSMYLKGNHSHIQLYYYE